MIFVQLFWHLSCIGCIWVEVKQNTTDKILQLYSFDFSQHCFHFIFSRKGKVAKKKLLIVVQQCVWSIWKARNEYIFKRDYFKWNEDCGRSEDSYLEVDSWAFSVFIFVIFLTIGVLTRWRGNVCVGAFGKREMNTSSERSFRMKWRFTLFFLTESEDSHMEVDSWSFSVFILLFL